MNHSQDKLSTSEHFPSIEHTITDDTKGNMNYSLVQALGVCKPISRQPAIAERSKLESDGLEPNLSFNLRSVTSAHFEPFFFILKTESENLLPYLSLALL